MVVVLRPGGCLQQRLTLFMGLSDRGHFVKHSAYLPSFTDIILRSYICFYLQLLNFCYEK